MIKWESSNSQVFSSSLNQPQFFESLNFQFSKSHCSCFQLSCTNLYFTFDANQMCNAMESMSMYALGCLVLWNVTFNAQVGNEIWLCWGVWSFLVPFSLTHRRVKILFYFLQKQNFWSLISRHTKPWLISFEVHKFCRMQSLITNYSTLLCLAWLTNISLLV